MKRITRISPALLLSCLPLLSGCVAGGIPDDLKLSAEQGDADAQYKAGQAYHLRQRAFPRTAGRQPSGTAWRQNRDMWTRSSSWVTCITMVNGIAEDGKEELGLHHMAVVQGKGIPKDGVEAAKWYRLAAEQGHVDAQFKLGYMHHHGDGIAENGKEALRWYRMAVEQDNAKAQHSLGVLYHEGLGVSADGDESRKWFMMAAENLRSSGRGGRHGCPAPSGRRAWTWHWRS